MNYTDAFNRAISHCMLYEVGGFWNENHPAVANGSIATASDRRAVGYVNDPVDRGGETKFGVAKNANPGLNITRLTWAQAKQTYYNKYWVVGKCPQLPSKIAIIHFDGCVNHGTGRAARFLQEALGVTVDGAIGPKTLAAINGAKEEEIVQHIARLRRAFYQSIVDRNKSQAKFLNGWMRRINEVETYALK